MVASGKADLECANTTQTLTRIADRRLLEADLPRRRRLPGQDRLADQQALPTWAARRSRSSRARRPRRGSMRCSQRAPHQRDRGADRRRQRRRRDARIGLGRRLRQRQDQADRPGRAGEGPGKLALLTEDLSYRALAFALPRNDSAFRLRGQPRADAGLRLRRDRDDLRAVAGHARPSVGPAGRDVPAQRDSRVIGTCRRRKIAMSVVNSFQRAAAAFAAAASLLLAGCSTPPAYEVSQPPVARVGTVESIQQDSVQNVPQCGRRDRRRADRRRPRQPDRRRHRQDGGHRRGRDRRRIRRQRAGGKGPHARVADRRAL